MYTKNTVDVVCVTSRKIKDLWTFFTVCSTWSLWFWD